MNAFSELTLGVDSEASTSLRFLTVGFAKPLGLSTILYVPRPASTVSITAQPITASPLSESTMVRVLVPQAVFGSVKSISVSL